MGRTLPTDGSLRGYVGRALPGRSTILVSNRGPQDPRDDGSFRRGAGGVVTGLLTLAEATDATWVACARTDAERHLAENSPHGLTVPLAHGRGKLHYVSPSREQYEKYYSVMANHVPWPTAQYWKVLPKHMRDPIVEGLLGCNVIGFQSSGDVRNFLLTCEENLGLQVDEHERAVVADGRVVYARHYPISVDVDATTRLASSRGVKRQEEDLATWRPPFLIARIDRTDPSKNIVPGFIAYEKLLRDHPELKGKVQFWAFLQPSRQDVTAYARYTRQIRQTAARINSEQGSDEWQPIRLEIAESERKAMAALKNFDVLLVNPVYDGLNLVAKEGSLVNQKNGVIVLSENAGAHEELRGNVLSVNPFDVEATAAAMYTGLTMSAEERHRLNEGARSVVRANDIARWISNQVQDLRDLTSVRTPA